MLFRSTVIPTEAQAKAVIGHFAKDLDMTIILVLAIDYAMRAGEIFALEWADIRKGSVRVNKSIKQAIDKEWVIGPPKSKASTRTLTVSSDVDALFDRKRAADGTLKLSGSIFPFTKNAFYKRYSSFVKDELKANFTFHALRHYCLTKYSEEGFSDPFIAAQAGHSLIVLNTIYKHLGVKSEDKQTQRLKKRDRKSVV